MPAGPHGTPFPAVRFLRLQRHPLGVRSQGGDRPVEANARTRIRFSVLEQDGLKNSWEQRWGSSGVLHEPDDVRAIRATPAAAGMRKRASSCRAKRGRTRIRGVVRRQTHGPDLVRETEPPVMLHRSRLGGIRLRIAGGARLVVKQHAIDAAPAGLDCEHQARGPATDNRDIAGDASCIAVQSPWWFGWTKSEALTAQPRRFRYEPTFARLHREVRPVASVSSGSAPGRGSTWRRPAPRSCRGRCPGSSLPAGLHKVSRSAGRRSRWHR